MTHTITFDLSNTGLKIPLVPIGNRLSTVHVAALPAGAVGLISLHAGGGSTGIPLYLVGQTIPVTSDKGLSIDNNNPGVFPVGTNLVLLVTYA